jgi:hypothetical protein
VFLVRYELRFISQETTFFIVTAVKTSDLRQLEQMLLCSSLSVIGDKSMHREIIMLLREVFCRMSGNIYCRLNVSGEAE